MSVLGEMMGGSHEFVHKGRTYKASLVTQEIKLALERRLLGKAKEAAAVLRDLMTPDEYASHLQRLNEGYIKGEYSLESARGQDYLQSVAGRVALCALLFGTDELDMMNLMRERQADVTSLVELLTKESFPDVVEDGKKKAP